ncbi:MAG: YegP family protein [Oscillospiraceae bacterium]|nr:YegP family protein [Oscillospiraceae bacterium]
MGRYEVKTVRRGYRFNLLAGNGQIVGTGEIYSAKVSCLGGIESVRRNAPIAPIADLCRESTERRIRCPRFEVYADRAGEYRFRLRARNGKIILVSEGYVRKEGCLNGIESVRRNADSKIEEV